MPRYNVSVNVTRPLKSPLTIWARDEQDAAEKAEALVMGWDGVVDCEITGTHLNSFER